MARGWPHRENGGEVEFDVAEREDLRDDNAPASKARLPFHRAADPFPLLSKTELEALAEDIKAHGQHEHIETLDDGDGPMVLDGRNRYNACLMAASNRAHRAERQHRSGRPSDQQEPDADGTRPSSNAQFMPPEW